MPSDAKLIQFSVKAATENKLHRDLREEALILVGLVLEYTTSTEYARMQETCESILELVTELEMRERKPRRFSPPA